MKRNIQILVPHPDDEFIYLSDFIKNNHKSISSIIFFTSGEFQLIRHIDIISYINTRRKESTNWINYIDKNIDIAWMPFPDSINGYKYLDRDFVVKAYKETYGITPFEYICRSVKNMIDENGILMYISRETFGHSTHHLLNEVGNNIKEKLSIMYGPQCQFEIRTRKEEYIHIKKKTNFDEKIKEFEYFYPSQKYILSLNGHKPDKSLYFYVNFYNEYYYYNKLCKLNME